MNRIGHIMVKMEQGMPLRAPCHLDIVVGASRPLNSIDGGGVVDHTLHKHTSAMRVRRAFHARKSLGKVGEQAAYYDDLEQTLGLSQTLSIELADDDNSEAIVSDLRSLDHVEWAVAEQLVQTSYEARSLVRESIKKEDIWQSFLHVGGREALEMEPGSPEIHIAVIDTGVALEHDELRGRLHTGFDTVDLGMGIVSSGVRLVGDSFGRDFCARDGTGHGTHVAGVLCANGLYVPPGVAGMAHIIPVRALAAAQINNNKLVGVGGIMDINAAIKVAVDLGANVLNMSFGTPGSSIDDKQPLPHSDVIEYTLSHGVIPIAAIGNSGIEEKYYPAALDGVIAVGSMSLDGQHSAFSTMGDHIALCAPGENIISTGLKGYRASTGTSHATPYVSGAVALMLSRAKKHGFDLNAIMARDILCETATAGTVYPKQSEIGSGMLNIPAALNRLDEVMGMRVE
jgi:subtilisin family serine protease